MTTIVNKPTESLHARIPQEMVEKLDSIATTLGRSRNWVFNEALKQYLEVQQWQTKLIKNRLAESENTKAEFVLHDAVMKRHEKRLKTKLKI